MKPQIATESLMKFPLPPVPRKFSPEHERAALKLVYNPLDWKDEIRAVLHIKRTIAALNEIFPELEPWGEDDLCNLIGDAVVSATATKAHMTIDHVIDERHLVVWADGYRMGPAGDH